MIAYMKKYLTVLSLFIVLALCSCNRLAGDPTTKTFSLHGYYTKLKVEGSFHVTVSNAANQVIVVAGENIMPKVAVEVVDETLKIYLTGPDWTALATDLEVMVPYNASLSSVALSGTAQLQSGYPIQTRKVNVTLSGASKCYCDIEAKELTIDLSGASEAVLKGKSNAIKAHVSGASRISDRKNEKQYALACDQFEGTLSGASYAFIHCDGSIKADLSGASKLHYTGNASTKGSNTSGNSQIFHDDL